MLSQCSMIPWYLYSISKCVSICIQALNILIVFYSTLGPYLPIFKCNFDIISMLFWQIGKSVEYIDYYMDFSTLTLISALIILWTRAATYDLGQIFRSIWKKLCNNILYIHTQGELFIGEPILIISEEFCIFMTLQIIIFDIYSTMVTEILQ